jgi:hypothetical protein
MSAFVNTPIPAMSVDDCMPHSFHLVSGKRESGKTRLVRSLLYKWHLDGVSRGARMDAVVCFSSTEAMSPEYKGIVPDMQIFPDFSATVVEKVIDMQKAHLKKYGHCQRVLMICDNCMTDRLFRTQLVRHMAMNMRHFGISLIITSQYTLPIPPAVRANVDYFWCLGTNNVVDKERHWKNFFGQVPTFQQFVKIFDDITTGYGCLVSDNRTGSISDSVKWYRAELETVPKAFPMGRSVYWKAARQRACDAAAAAGKASAAATKASIAASLKATHESRLAFDAMVNACGAVNGVYTALDVADDAAFDRAVDAAAEARKACVEARDRAHAARDAAAAAAAADDRARIGVTACVGL